MKCQLKNALQENECMALYVKQTLLSLLLKKPNPGPFMSKPLKINLSHEPLSLGNTYDIKLCMYAYIHAHTYIVRTQLNVDTCAYLLSFYKQQQKALLCLFSIKEKPEDAVEE